MIARFFAFLLCAASIGLFVLSSDARAQQPSPAAVAAAKEVIQLKGGLNMFDPVVNGVVEHHKNLLLQANPTASKDLEEVAKRLRTELAPRVTEIQTEIARAYASQFTEQELKDALAFYKTPLGKKLIEEEPKVLDQSMQVAQNWGDRLSEQVIAGMRNEMKKRGHDL